MIQPWRAAAQAMAQFYDSRGERWPAFEACRLMREVRVRKNRWVADRHVILADQILVSACFNVDEFVEYFLGATLLIENLEDFDADAGAAVYGYAKPESWTIAICERALEYEPLYRSTVMHEVAHLLLHSERRERVLAYSPGSTGRPPEERHADTFMHVALLPRSVLLLATARVAQFWDISIREALGDANSKRGRWQWRERLFIPLINTIGVSRQLMSIKLKSIGVFSQATVCYHCSYGLVTRWTCRRTPTPLSSSIDRQLDLL